MKLSIITLNYKTPEVTARCVDSVYEQYKKEFEKGEMEYIVVDNKSEDNSVPFLKEKFRQYLHVKIIANDENAGFGRGCNLGNSHATGEYVIFLNSDTVVTDKGFLEMISFLEKHKEISILGPKIINPDKTLQLSAWKFYTPYNLLLLLMGMERFKLLSLNTKKPSQVDWVSGACLMVQRKDFITLGEFDKNIFMYMEDMELCYRARQQAMLTYYYPFAIVTHMSHGSSNRTFAIIHIYKGILYFYKKHRPYSEYLYAKTLLKTKAIFLFIIGRILRNSYLYTTYGKALKIF